jgi:hypothetical protein
MQVNYRLSLEQVGELVGGVDSRVEGESLTFGLGHFVGFEL